LRAAGEEDIPPDALIVARDMLFKNRRTSKMFLRVSNWFDYVKILVEDKMMKHVYEVIPDGDYTPVWFFADHDCSTASANGMTDTEFIRGVCDLYFRYFGLAMDDLGELMFVSSTCRRAKLSVHVKINLQTSMLEAGRHALAVKNACTDSRLHPDMSVYRKGAQQIRCVGSSKILCETVKTPWKDKKKPKHMHLVRREPGHKQAVLDRAPLVPAPSPVAYNKISTTAATKNEVAGARKALANSSLPGMLGPSFCPNTCYIESPKLGGNIFFCYVDGSERRGGTLVCPFAKRPHRTNRASLMFYTDERSVEFRCCDAECVGRIAVPYEMSKY
jgi:hypothetical protein